MADFDEVHEAELWQVDRRRRLRGQADGGEHGDEKGVEMRERAHRRRLVGLAFSGGGIRSATFCLGFLQGLANLKLLGFFDYLSTVSGGGYIGSWLTAWARNDAAGMEGVEKALRTDLSRRPAGVADAEPAPLRHLRRHTNYLAPREGMFAVDGWALWAIYVRNFLLNQLVLLPAACAVMIISRLAMLLFYPVVHSPTGFLIDQNGLRTPLDTETFCWLAAAFTGCALVGFIAAFNAVRSVRLRSGSGNQAWQFRPIAWLIVLPFAAAAILFSYLTPWAFPWAQWLATGHVVAQGEFDWTAFWQELGLFAAYGAALVGVSHVVAGGLNPPPNRFWAWIGACLGGALWGGMVLGAYRLLFELFAWRTNESLQYLQISGAAVVTTFGPPLVLATFVLAAALGVGLFRKRLADEIREWWGCLSGRLLLTGAIWMTVNLVSLYGTPLVLWAGPWVQTALASGWVLTVAGSVVAGASRRTDGSPTRSPYLDLLARFGPHVFLAGIFILVSLLVHVAVDKGVELDANDEGSYPFRYEPENPPMNIVVERLRFAGRVTIKRQQEYHRLPHEAAAARMRYWLGMMNTGPIRPTPLELWLEDGDIGFLRQDGISQEVLTRLDEIRYQKWKREDFEASLNATLPYPEQQPVRDLVLQRVLENAKPNETTLVFKMDFLGNDRIADQDRFLLYWLQFRHFQPAELQDEIDRAVPAAWDQRARRLILQRAKGTGLTVRTEKKELGAKLGKCLLGCVIIFVVFSWCVDVNTFSLHSLYRNRLVRAYVGAARNRNPDPETRFDPDDDLPMVLPPWYDGPYPIVNTALNLVQTKELAWQERKAESFVLTPLFCGSTTTEYQPTDGAHQYAGGVTLGTAVAISGAAASPNMGYHSSPAVTFLLTVFNARLGSWLGNPRGPDWERSGPRFGIWQLFAELFGLTDNDSRYVYLSDGGHFENLGVYELIRRRCRYIVVCDAGQDENHAFEDLGNMIRKVRIDHHIRIEIAPDCLRLSGTPRHTRWHCAIGHIRYDDVDPGATPGTLVYVKPSLSGDEPADILHYAAGHPAFPHETTANQFYTESQFESYRALGQHIAEAIFQSSGADMEADEKSQHGLATAERHQRRCRELFASLVRRWFAMPPEYEGKFVTSTRGFVEIQEALRKDPRLWRLTMDLYPELDPPGRDALLALEQNPERLAECRAAELHVCLQMLQVMENAFLSLDLEVHYAHPLNRGWMDVFHRWTSSTTFRNLWPLLRAEFGREFVRFCEKQMRLGEVEGVVDELVSGKEPLHMGRMMTEFADQWPEYQDEVNRLLRDALAGAGPLAWTIRPFNPYPGQKKAAPTDEVPAGFVILSPALMPIDGVPVYDLFVWLRGAYRNTGLGRTAVRKLCSLTMGSIPRLLPRPVWLRVRLPARELSGPGGKIQKEMWLTFYSQLDFQPVTLPAGAAGNEIELRRKFD